ncbi:MAG: hypothetical protein ACR2FV_05250 [Ornithinimicrobium sp.]|jgi:D-xylose transport system ATP-binding protein|uniref:hypothetical protein n=1 Tax=Ornithinimicrobium sp. TaxID=1977084 RepID=UPI003D9B9AEC
MISHSMADVMAVADGSWCCGSAATTASSPVSQTTSQEVIAAITGATNNPVSARASRRTPEEDAS